MLGLVERSYLSESVSDALGTAIQEQKFMHGQCEALRSLVSWGEINSYLGSQILDPFGTNPSIRVVREGKDLPLSNYWVASPPYLSASSQPELNERALHDALRNGASVAINHMHRSFERVSEFAATLVDEIKSPVQVNGYASFRPTNAFNTHWDGHDVIAVQVEGAKRWKVYRPTHEFPLTNQPGNRVEFDKASAKLVWDGVLKAGEFIYVPRGWWHAVKTEETYSLHLTVGLRPVTGSNFLHWLVDQMLDDVSLRKDLPLLCLDEAGPNIVKSLRNQITTRLTERALENFAQSVLAYGSPKSRPSLPFISTKEFDNAEDYRLVWRKRNALKLTSDGDPVRLTDGSYFWTFSATVIQLD